MLAGRPGAFCAGFDLATMMGGDLDAIRTVAVVGAEIALRLRSCPKPVVAACTGHTFTIGVIWLCASDTRVGARGDFWIAMTETRMGVTLTTWALEPLAAGCRLGTGYRRSFNRAPATQTLRSRQASSMSSPSPTR